MLRHPNTLTPCIPTGHSMQDARSCGFNSVAVVFMHAYAFAEHEQQVGALATSLGFSHVSLSSATVPMVRIVPRGLTTCVDAYLTPLIKQYVDSFSAGFDAGFDRVRTSFMMSDGGLSAVKDFTGFKAILSGPAGGLVGCAATAYDPKRAKPVIAVDMGGTSKCR
jgi:5-oxoprolinase (ATP-hydrolysing)